MRTISMKTQPVLRTDRPKQSLIYLPYYWR
jgi:hypothetical protein